MLDPVYFLIAAERSGTTLLRLMLDHHPDIAWCSEFEYSVDQLHNGTFPSVSKYINWLKTDRVFELQGWQLDKSKSFPNLVDSFLVQKRAAKSIVGATVHRHFERLLKIWPHARFIYLIRDGRDVAKSRIVKGWDGNMFTAVDSWIEAEESWARLRAGITPDRWIEVTYSDLILKTTPTLTRVCQFLGTSFHDQMYTYPANSTYALPDPAKVTQWNRTMCEHDIQLAESKIGEMLQARGYPLSGLPPLKIAASQARHLCAQSRLVKLKRRIEEDGLTLITLEMLSRRLHLRPVHRACARRLNARINARLD